MEPNEFACVLASIPLDVLCIGWAEPIIRNLGIDLGPKFEPYFFRGAGAAVVMGLGVTALDAPWYLLVIAFGVLLPLARSQGPKPPTDSGKAPIEAEFVQRRSNTK